MKLPNFGYRAALWQGRLVRDVYRLAASAIVQKQVTPARTVALDVFSYSNEAMLPEQIASIRSFLRYVGRPNEFTVVSDGSHTAESARLLRQVDPSVRVEQTVKPDNNLPAQLRSYLSNHPTGKQMALIMSLPRNAPALYIDADVRFFRGGAALTDDLVAGDGVARYLADCQFSGDARLLRDGSEQDQPVNTGVLILFRPVDWSVAIERFPDSNAFAPDFFTNQTLTHLVMHHNGARALDRSRYVLQLDDQCEFADRYASPRIVLRHYVNPVRHKFWTSLLR